MSQITIEFPDKSKKQFSNGTTGMEIAKSISEGLAKAVVAMQLDGKLMDLLTPIEKSGKIKLLKDNDTEALEVLRHSTSHVLAEAVLSFYPKAKLAIGPSIKDGFYYDFDVSKPFTPEDLKKFEKKMLELIKKDEKFSRKELTKKEALKMFKDNKYKVELIKELPDKEKITIYSDGKFTDLCAGPHVPSTGRIKALKLLKTAGAYWRGNEKNKMLQRIYGISFPEKKQLQNYLTQIEEAKKRDHVKLGKELDLFSVQKEAPGFPFIHPNGFGLWESLQRFIVDELLKRDYKFIRTPLILNKELWVKSGHWDHYKENMYFTKLDEEEFAVKPMNCPGCVLYYNTKRRSYRELPLRIAELGLVHRHERSGVLHGTFRVRKFTQDDAHIFCTPEQIESEVLDLIELVDFIFKAVGFEKYTVELSTKPEKAMGSEKIWNISTKALENALKKSKLDYKINEGDGAFYGPKIDFHVIDSLGRPWQLSTIQVDMSMPEKLGAYYIGEDDKKHVPVMIHRAIFGSLERFIGILTEHYAGAFPTWLAPIQAIILNVNSRNEKFAKKAKQQLLNEGIRADLDLRSESIGKKVRDAQLQKIPYMLTVGDKEEKSNTVTIRNRNGKLSKPVKIENFVKTIKKEIFSKNKNLTSF